MLNLSAPEQPHWADIMQAWSSAAGVLTGLIAAAVAGLLLRQERRNADRARAQADAAKAEAAADRAALEAQRRDEGANHARSVVIQPKGVSVSGLSKTEIVSATAHVHNFGAGPIHDLRVELLVRSSRRSVSGYWPAHVQSLLMIPPGGDRVVEEQFDPPLQTGPYSEQVPLAYLFRVIFTDMTGRRWSRHSNGRQPERWAEPHGGGDHQLG